MVVRRGEIWWADLRPPAGSEPGFRRPVVVVQSDDFNRSSIRTVVVVAVSSNLDLQGAPGNVLLPKEDSGLPRDSVANVSQIVTVDRSKLRDRIGSLPPRLRALVEAGLRLVLALGPAL